MSPITLSTAQEETNTSNLKNTPVDIDNNPITFDGNPAYAEGVLHEVEKYWVRKGLFQTLLKTNSVLLPNGKEAVDSVLALPFITGELDYGIAHGFSNPCPPTPRRVELYNQYYATATAGGGTPKKFSAPAGLGPGSQYIISQPTIAAERTKLLDSLIQVIEPSDIAGELAEDAEGDGIILRELLVALAGEATPKDRALVRTEYTAVISGGLRGE